MNKKLLPVVWLLAIASLILLSGLLKLESTHFLGIADNHEQTISFSYPVEIVQTFAVAGAEVHQGKQILQVRRRDLGSKLAIIEDQIKALESTHNEELASTRAQLAGLKAQQAAELAEIDAQIHTFRSQQQLNAKLLKEISGKNSKVSIKSPLATRIQGLRDQRGHIQKSLEAQINNLQNQLNTTERPVHSKLAELKERELEFKRQVTDLNVQAKFNGRVGSVNYKSGEIVEPYQPILTVHGLSPKFIKGYIHENVFNQIKVGQKVWVQSNTSTNQQEPIHAIVESLGSRIVEYPVRLKKNMMVAAYGREAVIRLIQENSLLLGEKVVVSLEQPTQSLDLLGSIAEFFAGTIQQSFASTHTRNPGDPEGYPIRSRVADLKDHDIEASGVIQAQATDFYYIVSDESPNDQPELLKLNQQGEVVERLPISSKKSVDDLESISRSEESIFVLASLDRNKKKRRHLLRLQVNEDQVLLTGRLNLYKVLVNLSKNSADISTRLFLKQAIEDKSIQIEAHSVRGNDLYLGFKTPLNDQGETIFIKLDGLSLLFDDKNTMPNGSIWRKITLLDPETGSPANLSDMLFYGDELLLLGVNNSHALPSSHLWSYQSESAALTSIKSFDRIRAEGISGTNIENELLVVFDGDGIDVSRFLPISINTSYN